ncbi:MAG TPA: lysylphosphatidylglycerol synthase transmembrane domain-containing protein [Solirubrobacteraceae bacterium]|nr:lysylphosphatidylglycerol synthase transmembrane domain-containing protein [Solirubrobacteraceae bacterium]
MIDRIQNIADAVANVAGLIVDDAVALNPWWLVAGVLLHYGHQVVRIRGWWNILRASYPRADSLRYRDVTAAYFAGSGLNAVVPARGGDVMKLYMVKQRTPGARYPTLVASFVPEGLFETLCGIALLVWAFSRGFVPVPTSRMELPTLDVSLIIAHPILSTIVGGVIFVGATLLFRWLRRHGQRFLDRLRLGLAVLDHPRDYVTGVVSWQAAGRVIRLGSLACFMAAFSLPVTLASVVLVMAAQGGGRIIPIAPVSSGLRLAMLSYGLPEVTGQSVDIANITAFTVVVSAVLLVVSLTISLVIIFRVLGTLNPRHAVRRARTAMSGAYAAATAGAPARASAADRNSSR